MANSLWNKKRTFQIPDSLTHTTGTISAVFGSTTLNVAISGLSANTLYYLYIRKVSGVTSLVFVNTVPSTYRASFSDAVLVGAFYSNGLASVAFGSFVNIDGPAQTGPIPYLPVFTGLGTVTAVELVWTRSSVNTRMEGRFTNGTVTGSLATVTLPGALAASAPADFVCGNYGQQGSATGSTVGYSSGSNNLFFGMANWQIGATGTNLANSAFMSFNASLPITGWSNTPLKDL